MTYICFPNARFARNRWVNFRTTPRDLARRIELQLKFEFLQTVWQLMETAELWVRFGEKFNEPEIVEKYLFRWHFFDSAIHGTTFNLYPELRRECGCKECREWFVLHREWAWKKSRGGLFRRTRASERRGLNVAAVGRIPIPQQRNPIERRPSPADGGYEAPGVTKIDILQGFPFTNGVEPRPPINSHVCVAVGLFPAPHGVARVVPAPLEKTTPGRSATPDSTAVGAGGELPHAFYGRTPPAGFAPVVWIRGPPNDFCRSGSSSGRAQALR